MNTINTISLDVLEIVPTVLMALSCFRQYAYWLAFSIGRFTEQNEIMAKTEASALHLMNQEEKEQKEEDEEEEEGTDHAGIYRTAADVTLQEIKAHWQKFIQEPCHST
jgi:hypothetical protein